MSAEHTRRMRRTRRNPEEENQADMRVMDKAWSSSQGIVKQHPMSTALVVFGIGLGVGVVLGSMISAAATPPPSFGQRAELAAEKLGRQMMDAMSRVLPHSIAKHVA